jgi:acetyl esterase/lipase
MKKRLLYTLVGGLSVLDGLQGEEPLFKRESEVIYGRKHGLAMTLDVFQPLAKRNGRGIVFAISGGWFSAHSNIDGFARRGSWTELIKRGYSLFAVVHGSQPKYTIPEIREDMHRAVRFIRHNAKSYRIDPKYIGIIGGSAGGHLSLMQGTAGRDGHLKAKDPVERQSSRVQAVVAYFPPTDFLNYGAEGEHFDHYIRKLLDGKNPYLAALDFHSHDHDQNWYYRIIDETKRSEQFREAAPVTHVSGGDAPTLLVHGDADKLVPIQQAHRIMPKFKAAGVEAKLLVMPGKDHGWEAESEELKTVGDWFDRHLLIK